LVAQFRVQRDNAPKATIPHAENKPRASNANPSAAFFFFEEVAVEEADDPLAVPLPEDVPVPVGEVEGLAVGAGDAPGALTSKSVLCG